MGRGKIFTGVQSTKYPQSAASCSQKRKAGVKNRDGVCLIIKAFIRVPADSPGAKEKRTKNK